MLHCDTFSVLLLVGVCLSAWAAPLGSTLSSQTGGCDGTEQGSRETAEHLQSHDDKLCGLLTPSPSVEEGREHEGISDGEVTGENGHSRQTGSVQVKNQGYSKDSTDESLLTPTSMLDSIDSLKVGSPGSPFELSTGTSAEMLFTPGHSDYIKSGGLLYSSVDEDKGTVLPLIRAPPQEDKEEREEDTIKKNRSAELNPKGASAKPPFMVSSSTYDSVTSPTTSGSPDGEAGGSKIVEESLFTATELQDKALAPGYLQPDLTFSSSLAELGGTWTEPVHLGVEEVSILPLSQEVGTEATMSSEDLPLIFDDVTPPSSSALASELSVAMVPATGMLGEAELEQTVSVGTEHAPSDASLLGPSDWPSPWQMSGSENSDVVVPSQMPVSGPFSEGDLEHTERTERLQNKDVISASMRTPLSPSHVLDTTQQVTDFTPTPSTVKTGLDELESEEEEDEEEEDVDESEEEEDSEEDPTEAPARTPTRPPYSLIPPPPVWGQQNQGLIRSWVELIREKAGYVSGMLAPVGIGIAGALLIVGALYSIRMIHRRRKNSFKHQRRKQPREVRNGPDQAMLLADSSEDEF